MSQYLLPQLPRSENAPTIDSLLLNQAMSINLNRRRTLLSWADAHQTTVGILLTLLGVAGVGIISLLHLEGWGLLEWAASLPLHSCSVVAF